MRPSSYPDTIIIKKKRGYAYDKHFNQHSLNTLFHFINSSGNPDCHFHTQFSKVWAILWQVVKSSNDGNKRGCDGVHTQSQNNLISASTGGGMWGEERTGNAGSAGADTRASTAPAASRLDELQVPPRSGERCHSTPLSVCVCVFVGEGRVQAEGIDVYKSKYIPRCVCLHVSCCGNCSRQ